MVTRSVVTERFPYLVLLGRGEAASHPNRPQTTSTTATGAGQRALPELLLWEYNANCSRSIFIEFVCTQPQRHARASVCEWQGEKKCGEGGGG